MERITLRDAQKFSSPNPFALVSTMDQDGSPNLMALSWWTYCSNNPPTIAVCLSKRGYSGKLISHLGEFALCLPDETLQEQAFMCGTCSGRDNDKPGRFGIALTNAEIIAPKLVRNSKVALECRLVNTVEAGDHNLYIAEIVAAHGNADAKHLLTQNGYASLQAY